MKTYKGNGYLVHSSDQERNWKTHKYVYKRKMPNGKWRYFYQPKNHNLYDNTLGRINGLHRYEGNIQYWVNQANKAAENGKDTSEMEKTMIAWSNMANGESPSPERNGYRIIIPEDKRPKPKHKYGNPYTK